MTTQLFSTRRNRGLQLLGLAGLLLASAALAATADAPAAASGAAPTPPTPAPSQPTAASLKPPLPMDFSDFAAGYQTTDISPPWLEVQVGTLETYYAPPSNMNSFVLAPNDFRQDLAANYNPIVFSCLMGAKSRYENETLISLDKAGHPLGYSLAMGKVIYFLARGETDRGISYSIHYFDSGKELVWIPNPDKDGNFIPMIRAISVTQSFVAPADNYVFFYLAQRFGTQKPDSQAKPLTLYTYLVIHVRPIPQVLPAAATGIVGGY